MKLASFVLAMLIPLLCAEHASATWIETLVQPTPIGSTDITDINKAESVLLSPPAGSAIQTTYPSVIDETDFGLGSNAEAYAVEAKGYVTGLSGPTMETLYVNSDDGFRVRINGNEVLSSDGDDGLFQYIGMTAGSNVTSDPVLLSNGDFIDLTYFQWYGGEFLNFQLNDGSGPYIGSVASGIGIIAPEPSSLILFGFGAGSLLLALRYRRSSTAAIRRETSAS